jgi:hypothetical protein
MKRSREYRSGMSEYSDDTGRATAVRGSELRSSSATESTKGEDGKRGVAGEVLSPREMGRAPDPDQTPPLSFGWTPRRELC